MRLRVCGRRASYPPFGRHIILDLRCLHLSCLRPACHRHGSSIITHPPFGIHIILDLRCTASALSAFHPFLSSVRKTYHTDLRCAASALSASCLPPARFPYPFYSSVRQTYHNDLRCAASVFSASCLPKARIHFFLLIPNTVQPPITKTNDQDKIDHVVGHQNSLYPPSCAGRCKPSSCK